MKFGSAGKDRSEAVRWKDGQKRKQLNETIDFLSTAEALF
jgi:hypothetical protein